MLKSRLALVLTALFALAIPATASAADPLDPAQWSGTPKSGSPFFLYNSVNKNYIDYGSRTFGPDLEWERKTTYASKWTFFRPRVNGVTDHRGTLSPDEKVSLYNARAKKYLIYQSRRTGINLGWSKSPSAEWRVGTGTNGAGISLFNTKAGDYVVHGKRSFGINLQWLKDLRKAQANADKNAVGTVHDASVTMTAQPPVQGYVPFLGSYGGGGTKGVLTKVSNPANGAPLFFLKRGRSSTECGNPDATLPLNPGQTMSAADMTALWGSSTPSLATPVPFLACAATQASTVRVNVQWRVTG